MTPITGVAFCCALRGDGQTVDAVAAPPRRVLNSRRLIQASEAQDQPSCSASKLTWAGAVGASGALLAPTEGRYATIRPLIAGTVPNRRRSMREDIRDGS